jgi:hypothetical protein
VAVLAAGEASGALSRDGRLVLWGREGRLEPAVTDVVAADLGLRFGGALRADGLVTWFGAPGSTAFPPAGLQAVSALSLGWRHVVALGAVRPVVVAYPQPVLGVLGQPEGITLNVTARGTGPLHYQWLRNGEPLPEAAGPTLKLPAEAASRGLYQVVVSNFLGLAPTPDAEVTLLGPAQLTELRLGTAGSLHARLVRDGSAGWQGLPGRTVRAEVSDDLRTWRAEVFSLDAKGRLVIAPDFGRPPARFYRVREE